jgi:hypothetical protein
LLKRSGFLPENPQGTGELKHCFGGKGKGFIKKNPLGAGWATGGFQSSRKQNKKTNEINWLMI